MFGHPGPVLADALTANPEPVMPPKIRLEQATGFSLFMLKAIMSARGDEVVALAEANLFRRSARGGRLVDIRLTIVAIRAPSQT